MYIRHDVFVRRGGKRNGQNQGNQGRVIDWQFSRVFICWFSFLLFNVNEVGFDPNTGANSKLVAVLAQRVPSTESALSIHR